MATATFEPPETKLCRRCNEIKSEEKFCKDAKHKDGRASWCIQCKNDRTKELISTGRKAKRAIGKIKMREFRLKCKYGITADHVDEILKRQNYQCDICGRLNSLSKLEIDHSHESGKIRSLLCHRCNLVLGMVDDDVYHLQKFIRYIRRHESDV